MRACVLFLLVLPAAGCGGVGQNGPLPGHEYADAAVKDYFSSRNNAHTTMKTRFLKWGPSHAMTPGQVRMMEKRGGLYWATRHDNEGREKKVSVFAIEGWCRTWQDGSPGSHSDLAVLFLFDAEKRIIAHKPLHDGIFLTPGGWVGKLPAEYDGREP